MGGELFRKGSLRHAERVGVDINEVNYGPAIERTVSAGYKAVGACPDGIARTNIKGEAGDVKRTSCAIYCYCVRSAHNACDPFFKLRYDWALGKKLRPQHRHHRGNVFFRDGLSSIGNHLKIIVAIDPGRSGMDANGWDRGK
jgi:hypothetical protein